MKITQVLLGALLMAGCSQKPQVPANEFMIEGQIEALPDSCIVQLLKFEGQTMRVVAVDTVLQGHFSFQDTISEKTKYGFAGRGSQFPTSWSDIWVTPGSYTSIKGTGTNFKVWDIENEVPEQQEVNAYFKAIRPEWTALGALSIELNKWYDMQHRYYKSDSVFQLTKSRIKPLRHQSDSITQQITVKGMQQLLRMSVTPWWISMLESKARLLQYDPRHPAVPYVKEAIARLSDADKQTEKGKIIMEYANLPEPVLEGDQMVDGDLYDLDGQLHHLSELMGNGKYLLLDFWSRGCGPCVASMPEMEEVAQEYASRLSVVSISDDSEDVWKAYVKEKGFKGNHWNQLGKSGLGLKAVYRVCGIPHYVMIAPDGKVLDTWTGYETGYIRKKMKQLIGQ